MPTRASRPFDVDRDGFVMGDGAGILVLERAERARRAARAFSRAFAVMVRSPMPITSLRPIRRAFTKSARCATRSSAPAKPAKRCDVVYAHATGTIVGDAAESKAIDEVYADRRRRRHLDQRTSRTQHGERRSDVRDRRNRRACTKAAIPPTMGTQHVDPQTRFDLVIGAASRDTRTRPFKSTLSASADKTRR